MGTRVIKPISFLLLLLSLLSSSSTTTARSTTTISSLKGGDDEKNQCVYTLYIQTGNNWKAGTDSVIGLELAGYEGSGLLIKDLVSWAGLMGPDHDYYERGNLDIFSGRGPCLPSPPCWMNLTSDESGSRHGWYCDYVEVTTAGPHANSAHQVFTVDQWLATDASPYKLYAVRNNCRNPPTGANRRRIGGQPEHVLDV